VKYFTLYGSPHSIPTYKVALMMRRISASVPLGELPDADAQDVGVFSFPPGASCGSSRQWSNLHRLSPRRVLHHSATPSFSSGSRNT
jgi:hypothetical protein